MATSGTPVTSTLTPYERTWNVAINTPMGTSINDPSDYSLTINRQQVLMDQNSKVVGEPQRLPGVTIPFSAIAAQNFTTVVGALTGVQLAAFLAETFDQLYAQFLPASAGPKV